MRLAVPPIKNARQRGSILVICMVLAGIGTIGAAAFFSLIQAKSVETLERENAMARRIKVSNSRAIAKEALLHAHLGASAAPVGGAEVYTWKSGWGEATISPHLAAPLAANTSTRLNKTGYIAPLSFTEDVQVTLSDGNSNIPHIAHAKSYHPALAGDLLVVQRPVATDTTTTQFTGSLNVKGRAVFYGGNYSTATSPIRADRVIKSLGTVPPTSMLNTAGAAILPDNGTLPPVTSGFVGGSANFSGQTNLVANPNSTVNDYSEYVANHSGRTFSGNGAFVTSASIANRPPGTNDPALMAITGALVSPWPATLPATLLPQKFLSSQVLLDLLGRNTTADSAVLSQILLDHSPLPVDVLQAVVADVELGTAKWVVIRANPVGAACDGLGTLYMDLDTSPTILTHLHSQSSVQNIIFRGQATSSELNAAAVMPPLVVATLNDATAPLLRVDFEGSNSRPLIFAAVTTQTTGPVISNPDIIFTGSAFPSWRALIELENTAADFDTSSVSAATLVGGIRTDRSINVIGTLTLDRETNATAITALQGAASRNAWLEVYNIP